MRKFTRLNFIIFMLLAMVVIQPKSLHAQSLPLDPIVSQHLDQNGDIGITIRDYDSGEIVYSLNGDIPRSTASGMKLLTGAAALQILGKDYRFKTQMYYDGTIKNSVLNGNIYIVGSGDPTMRYNDYSTLAWQLKHIGIKKINGYIFGDDTKFTGDSKSPGVVRTEAHHAYAARTSAITMAPNLTFNTGSIKVVVRGSKIDAIPTVSAEPTFAGMTVKNNAVTGEIGSANSLSISRKDGANEIIISGSIPAGSKTAKLISMRNPTINTLHAFTEAIRAHGIKFTHQDVVAVRNVPESATLIAERKSLTLGELYPSFMKLSNNQIADILAKTIGYEVYGIGSLNAGIAGIKDYGNNTLGLNMDNWTILDGSGLSRNNKASSNELSQLMINVRAEKNYPLFFKGLSIAGNPSKIIGGSLNKRFTSQELRNHVIAKTGYIHGVHTLTGIVKGNTSQNHYVFSIMTENYSGSIKGIDAVLEAIIRYF